MLALVHDMDYIKAFSEGRLDAQRIRQIGFGDTTSTPILVERTKVEVAGGWWAGWLDGPPCSVRQQYRCPGRRAASCACSNAAMMHMHADDIRTWLLAAPGA
jgi:hypothetical protein